MPKTHMEIQLKLELSMKKEIPLFPLPCPESGPKHSIDQSIS
jgi:hypothetical protein